MVSDTQSERLSVADAVELRREAGDLLNRLLADREQSERRIAETGKRDPMKAITGRTALDAAIASAREMIGQMDTLLARLHVELEHVSPAARPQSRPTQRMTHRPGLRGHASVQIVAQDKLLSPVPTP